MPKQVRNFVSGRMNKVLDERLVPNGEYIDALNVRMGSTEDAEIGAIENSKGNEALTALKYIDGTPLSASARCIGAIEDSSIETLYWFVHDPESTFYPTGKMDMIVSYNALNNVLAYHIISVDDGSGVQTTLNFNPQYLITAIDIVDDLIFFTDNYNPPRFFNVKRNYPDPTTIDGFSAESILVIKKPPTEAPTIEPFLTQGQDNFIDTRFICFAYRYRYEDNEYSATSQWSEPAFTPNPFNFSVDSYLNEGMVNSANAVKISFNTGGPLVKAIDLLFKEASSNLIKVINKLNKVDQAYTDNSIQEFIFNNSKIFTILPEYEILRLYDNVPLLAKSQTIMGNRLIYGNYTEGYDMLDSNEQPVQLIYTADLISEEIGLVDLADTTSSGNYNINGAQTVPNSVLNIDFSGIVDGQDVSIANPLLAGGVISLEITLTHAMFTGSPAPIETSQNIEVPFSFFLANNYNSIYELAISTEFQNAIKGLPQTVFPNNSCNATSLTDLINCQIPLNLDALTKYASGINAQNQPINIVTTAGSQVIGLQFVAMRFVNSTSAPTVNIYEYYEVEIANAIFQKVSNSQSLHSNRGYEVGIVYMDEFNRATTSLVSINNAVHVPCGSSGSKNSIQITIPPQQKPPSWASRYKFVIKADQENYETIYCSIFFNDPNSNWAYLLLEGENAQKVEVGDRLIVKADTSGAVQNCVETTVLEKKVQASGFLTIPSSFDPELAIPVPSGLYIKVHPNNFETISDDSSIISYGTMYAVERYGGCPAVFYPVNFEGSGGFVNYSVPSGSRIRLFFKFERLGLPNAICEKRTYILDKSLISSNDYDSFQEWWIGDDVESILNDGQSYIDGSPGEDINNVFNPVIGNFSTVQPCDFTNHFQFLEDTSTGQMILAIGGQPSCTGNDQLPKRQSKIWASIDVYRTETTLIFETQPSDALPDIFFENNLSLPIENGFHVGTSQNQTSSLPAIIDTGFYNCFSFGNGAESYKIRDSVTGRTFNLGNRVTSVSAQDYQKSIRFADLTYSGVYNDESNVNKLNEFNLGLLNYKPLEDSFGPIFKLDGRETDILVLQEDKISYVLAGKNLLSDSVGTGAVVSIPEVLGIQIARTEKFGISSNPESYVNWGYDRYFTDTKRGSVIQIKGNSYSSDQLTVVSESGMRTWFRDTFIDGANTQKLGGYDPFMGEYVLTSNDISLPIIDECIACGIMRTFTVELYDNATFCVDVGQLVGDSTIIWSVVPTGVPFEVFATYNNITVSSGTETGSGSLIVNKNIVSNKTITVEVVSSGHILLEINVGCPDADIMQVVQVAVTNNSDAGQFIHNEYRYTSGVYVSPTTSNLVEFAIGTDNPLVSSYNVSSGLIGQGMFPVPGSTVRLISNKIGFDDFVFNPDTDNFRYLASSVLYPNTPVGIAALLVAASVANPNQGSGTNHYAEFTMPANNTYLYLIWDYRASHEVSLCYSDNINDACCDCCNTECDEYFVSNASGPAVLRYIDCETGLVVNMDIGHNTGYFICSDDYTPYMVSGAATIQTISLCGCDVCAGLCVQFEVEVTSDAVIEYTPCGGEPISQPFLTGFYIFCTSGDAPTAVSGSINISFTQCGCS